MTTYIFTQGCGIFFYFRAKVSKNSDSEGIGQEISKLFYFFSETYIFFFFKYSRVTNQKTRIGTLNSNIESILKNVGKYLIDMRKTVLFGKISNSTAFYYLCSQFSRLLKNNLIFVFSFLMRVFWTVTRLYSEEIFFKLSYRRSQTLKKYKSKKNKNSFEIPWPRAIKCPPNQNSQKKVLHPNLNLFATTVFFTLYQLDIFQRVSNPSARARIFSSAHTCRVPSIVQNKHDSEILNPAVSCHHPNP